MLQVEVAGEATFPQWKASHGLRCSGNKDRNQLSLTKNCMSYYSRNLGITRLSNTSSSSDKLMLWRFGFSSGLNPIKTKGDLKIE